MKKNRFCIISLFTEKNTHQMNLKILNKPIKQASYVKYLGLIIGSNLNWKNHIHQTYKISRGIGVIANLRQLYYWFIYLLIMYCLIIWGNIYTSIIKPTTVATTYMQILFANSIFAYKRICSQDAHPAKSLA